MIIKNITTGQTYYPLITTEEIIGGSRIFEIDSTYQSGDTAEITFKKRHLYATEELLQLLNEENSKDYLLKR